MQVDLNKDEISLLLELYLDWIMDWEISADSDKNTSYVWDKLYNALYGYENGEESEMERVEILMDDLTTKDG